MAHVRKIGYELSANNMSSGGGKVGSHGFSRRETTDVRIQSKLHLEPGHTPADRAPTLPVKQPDPFLSLEEQTLTGHTRADSLAPHAILAQIAAIEGFVGGAILDVEWDELLCADATPGLDIELAAQLAISALPRLAGDQPRELVTTTASHYELISIIEGPFVTLCCYTLWDRARTNLAITRAAMQPPLTQLAHKQRPA